MSSHQSGILAPVPTVGRFLTLGLSPRGDARRVLEQLALVRADAGLVVGLGAPLLPEKAGVTGLRPFPAVSGRGVAFPSTQGALWLCLGGDDAGDLLQRARGLLAPTGDAFRIDEDVLSFRYGPGRDLSGYEDGTENPRDEKAVEVAIVAGQGQGLDGGSFVAAQRWVHDLSRLEGMPQEERDLLVGRRQGTNEEIASAPASAHVKRTAQESFDPPAFMVRRSMPWGTVSEHGLYFVAYGASLDPFERALERMAGLEDGIVDGLLSFTRPVTGGYYWCPPVRDGRLDLRALGPGSG